MRNHEVIGRSATVTAPVNPDTAVRIVRDLLSAAAVADDARAELSLEFHEPTTAGFCLVCVKTPLGNVCLVPPGGSC